MLLSHVDGLATVVQRHGPDLVREGVEHLGQLGVAARGAEEEPRANEQEAHRREREQQRGDGVNEVEKVNHASKEVERKGQHGQDKRRPHALPHVLAVILLHEPVEAVEEGGEGGTSWRWNKTR